MKNLLFKEAKNYIEKEAKHLKKGAKHLSGDRHSMQHDSMSIVVAAIAGVAIGAALGILFAPNRGSETRHAIADKAKGLGSTVADKAKQGKEKITDLTDKAVDAIKSKTGAGTGTNTTSVPSATEPLA